MDIFFGTDTSPSSGDSSPVIIRKMVVLPAPFGPTRPTFSPGLSWKEVSTKSTCRPYCLLMRERESTRTYLKFTSLAAPGEPSGGGSNGIRQPHDEFAA